MVLRKFLLSSIFLVAAIAGAQRLPPGVRPEHYALTFTPDIAAASFAGDELIEVKVQNPTNSITLNSADIQFQKATVTQGKKSQEARVTLDEAKEQATLTVAAQLAPGPAMLQIQFTGTLNDKLRGFYLAKTKLRRYATTQFESTDARRAFPAFDEPALKATFDITLVVDNGDTAISNGRIVSDTPGPSAGKHTLKFSTTPKMSTYLVAMAVGDFQCSQGEADGIPIRICGTPDKKPLEEAALRYAPEILKYYNQYYGIQYPYGKLDVVGLPDFEAGAMENTAAIFYRESLLFLDDKNSSVGSHAAVFMVLAHEMAHQWFGDLVTMKWWDNLWLNEGFANWMARKPMQALHPEWNAGLDAVREANLALVVDSLHNTHPIRAKAETPDEIEALFDSISYNKGAAVIRMIESYVSPDVFRRAVNIYLHKFQYSNATAEDFWTTLAQVSHRPVDKIMPTFISQPGVPLVTVKAECIGSKAGGGKGNGAQTAVQQHGKTEITLAQQRFFTDGDADSSHQLWVIPVCIKSSDDKPFCQLLEKPEQVVSVAGCSSWVFANADAVGYYRTQYAKKDLRNLSDGMVSRLSTAERMALISDEAGLIRAGKDKIGLLLDLVGAVNDDPQRAVVESYSLPLSYIDDYLVTAADRDSYHAWLRTVFRPMLAKVGWTPSAGESDETHALRADLVEILGKVAQDPDTTQESKKLARQYLHAANSVDPTLVASVLNVAASAGDAALLNEYLAALPRATTPEQFVNLGRALGEFRGPELAQRILQLSLSPAVRSQDSARLIATMLRNPANQDAVWLWIKSHWTDIEKKIPPSGGAQIIAGSGEFCDAGHRDDVTQFFSEHKVPFGERVLKQVSESINSCISYRDHQQSNLAAWLGQHSGAAVAGQN